MIRALALAAGFFFSAVHSASADTQDGEALAQSRCAQCHAIAATGESPYKDAPPFRDIMKRYPSESLAEALAEGIVVGHHAMPEFRFTPEEIDALLSYLDTLAPQ